MGNKTNKKRIFITGVGGMMGSHLSDKLANEGNYVTGIDFVPTTDISELNKNVKYIECDIRDKNKLTNILQVYKPEIIYHLAAQSYPTVSWDRPIYTIDTNIGGTINLFEAVKELKLDPIIINAGSSAIYGFIDEKDVPVKETHELKPLHPYGITKAAQEMLAYQYYQNFKIKSVTMRIFNTTGPKKVNDAPSDFVRRIVDIEKGITPPILKVGNLETRRGLTDVRDLNEGLICASKLQTYGEAYNISGEKIYQMKEIINILKTLSKTEFEIEQDPSLIRTTDEPIIYGDSSKFKKVTNWKQTIPIEKTLEDMLNYWRNK